MGDSLYQIFMDSNTQLRQECHYNNSKKNMDSVFQSLANGFNIRTLEIVD